MKKLLKFELSKIKTRKSLYICTAIMVAMLLLNVLTMWGMDYLMSDLYGEEDAGMLAGMFQNDMISTVLSAAGNGSFTLLCGIVIALFVCSDYSQGTVKTVVARGFSRTRIYFAKLAAIAVMSVFMYLTVILFGWLFGMLFFGFDAPSDLTWLATLSVQFVSAIGFAAFAFFLSAVLRKTVLAVIAIIAFPAVIELVITMIDLFAETNIGDYWITTVFTMLSQSGIDSTRIIIALFVSVAYAAAFVTGGWALSRKYSY
ncbi:MAG: hypothetical protein E7612_06245 [Ruminococcaceae bacterium]|nr:hypothetical protein [Oscillospiraceae bacterium]